MISIIIIIIILILILYTKHTLSKNKNFVKYAECVSKCNDKCMSNMCVGDPVKPNKSIWDATSERTNLRSYNRVMDTTSKYGKFN